MSGWTVRLPGAARTFVRLVALWLPLAVAWPGTIQAATAPMQAEQDALQAHEQARQALAAGQWDEAELLLERVLMLMPENAEARLDFALLLARRGARVTLGKFNQFGDSRPLWALTQALDKLMADIGGDSESRRAAQAERIRNALLAARCEIAGIAGLCLLPDLYQALAMDGTRKH